MTKPKLTTDRVPDPPQPPDIQRRISIPLPQWVGVAILLTILGLTAGGFLDRREMTAHTTQHGVAIDVTWTTRARYREDIRIDVQIRNETAAVLDSIAVEFPRAIVGRATDVSYTPGASGARTVLLTAVPPGVTREIVTELRPSFYGRRSGPLTFRMRAGTAVVDLSVFILP